jgi:putative FmdB family regulatory protein
LTIPEVFVPTYSYACTECGDRFDAVQAFSDSALTTCAKCNGRLRKLFGNVGVVFKGSGFYRNDSREAAKSSAKTSSSSSNGSAGSESTSASSTSSSSTEKSSSEKSSSNGSSSSSPSSAPAAAASS